MPTPRFLVRIEDKTFDYAINLERVNHIQRIQSGILYLYFTGEELPLRVEGEAAESLWRAIVGSALCVHRRPAVEKEVAEVESSQTAANQGSEKKHSDGAPALWSPTNLEYVGQD